MRCCSRRQREPALDAGARGAATALWRSEEHTSELQSRQYLVCRLLLEKKKKKKKIIPTCSTRYNFSSFNSILFTDMTTCQTNSMIKSILSFLIDLCKSCTVIIETDMWL